MKNFAFLRSRIFVIQLTIAIYAPANWKKRSKCIKSILKIAEVRIVQSKNQRLKDDVTFLNLGFRVLLPALKRTIRVLIVIG